MSRSIHTTRRDLAQLARSDYANRVERSNKIQRIGQELRKKRAIKAQIVLARHQAQVHTPLPLAVDLIPIDVYDQSDWVHYPASEQDIRAVMCRLPPGELNGITRIVLCLGEDEQLGGYGCEPDPLVGRNGIETLPGVFCGGCLGVYLWDTATIKLFAYIYDADTLPDKVIRELYLRLQVLSTLVHEIAHHKGELTRGRRGRWGILSDDTSERYAHRQERHWMKEIVVPYLEEAYPDEIRAFSEWMTHYGGVSLPLASFADDAIYRDFPLSSAVESLAAAVDAGESLRKARLGFAHDLRLALHYDAALQCIARVLAEDVEDVETLALQATTYGRQERYEEAESAAKAALALDATCEDAWHVLVDVCKARADWRGVEAATSKLIEQSERPLLWERIDRVRARLELGDFAGAEADIQALAQLPHKNIPRRLAFLSALMLLRQGRYAEALAAALIYFKNRKRIFWEKEMLAVHFEAAHRLGKPGKAGRLTDKDILFLRKRGYAAWMDRLIADYGAGKKHV